MMDNLSSFRHILVIEDQKARRIVALEEASYSVGRESTNDIVIYEQVVSRRHATIVRVRLSPRLDTYSYRIIDGDLEGNRSTNGLLINGKLQQSHNLKHGDVVIFGPKAKVSYYIISTALDIDLFNPLDPEQFEVGEETVMETMIADDNNNSTLINEESLQARDRNDLIRLASFPELSPNPIIEIDFTGNLTYLNPAARIKFQSIEQEKLKHPILAGLLSELHNIQGNLLLREVVIGSEIFEQYVHYLSEHQLIRSYLFDITARKQAEKRLEYRAFYDTLTDLPNRNYFDENLEIALVKAKNNNNLMAVVFLDLDCFKNINDSLGHKVGDQLLKSFAQRLSSCVRNNDIISRWGGDEFTVLLPQINSPEDTINLAQRILEDLKQPFEVAGHQLYVKTSIGIAIYPQDGEDGETLLKNADAALYRAKERGRNHYRFYSSTMTSKASLLLKLENLLYQALEEESLSLHYQPQLNLTNNKVSGMEALLRWYHPEFGNVSPLKLITLAEKTDLIIPISLWVLKTACLQNKAWQKRGFSPIPIAVNLSPKQFQQPNLVDIVAQVLEDTALEPHLLDLEITETAMMQNIDSSRETLQNLRELGVQVSLDDFGTGYSSLGYLQKFPVTTLKIDQSFIQTLQANSGNTAIISAIIALGQSFDLRVIAEGVETLQQLELLQGLNCREIQGFWFSRPLKPTDATTLLSQV
ncbi:EAL domain-containing protein [Crocosphaera watsonii]|uniref:Diguanylate cyclase/phosphodiesterase (GGDEF & EAL domains) with GAF sensor and FHA domain n=3 Tax=Crocosphaera watsonii TaxID=263511 RepID=G5J632_CROWT|nr:EAL domain-containing protein [Crocosphaera watsonii]EHJ12368.1 Putative diguanylate cyclase/phosphodiesterase (GGDEF & EAL domains) with GAF sensor and FHA domain [Crocosphaera watsonii WH 0003]